MPPKTKFTREDVIKAALEVTEKHGLRQLTARKTAAVLGSSTAPITSHFKTMEDLEIAAVRSARDILVEYTSRPFTPVVFLNLGTGIAIFARDRSELFRAVFLESHDYKEVVQEFLNAMTVGMAKDPRFESMPADKRETLLFRMWTFTHGLASQLAIGLTRETSDQYIIETLQSMGGIVIGAALKEGTDQTKPASVAVKEKKQK